MCNAEQPKDEKSSLGGTPVAKTGKAGEIMTPAEVKASEFGDAMHKTSDDSARGTVKFEFSGSSKEKVRKSEVGQYKRKRIKKSGLIGYLFGHTEEEFEEAGVSNVSEHRSLTRNWAIGVVIVITIGTVLAGSLWKHFENILPQTSPSTPSDQRHGGANEVGSSTAAKPTQTPTVHGVALASEDPVTNGFLQGHVPALTQTAPPHLPELAQLPANPSITLSSDSCFNELSKIINETQEYVVEMEVHGKTGPVSFTQRVNYTDGIPQIGLLEKGDDGSFAKFSLDISKVNLSKLKITVERTKGSHTPYLFDLDLMLGDEIVDVSYDNGGNVPTPILEFKVQGKENADKCADLLRTGFSSYKDGH